MCHHVRIACASGYTHQLASTACSFAGFGQLPGLFRVQEVGVYGCADAGEVEAVGIPADCYCQIIAEAFLGMPLAGVGEFLRCRYCESTKVLDQLAIMQYKIQAKCRTKMIVSQRSYS